jgi:hypothetical protein
VANITVIRTALAAQIQALASPFLRSLPEPEDSITPPVGVVMPARPYVKYGVTLEGATGFLGSSGTIGISPENVYLDYIVLLAHASTLGRIEQNLDAWLGFESDATAVSIPAAVHADPTLGGTCEWCVPTTVDPPSPIDWNGLMLFGSRIHFELSVR